MNTKTQPPKHRVTVTLPRGTLAAAARIARARKVRLSIVIAELLDAGLRTRVATERSSRVLESYRRAFAGFSDEEMMLLDGVLLDEPIR